MTIVSDTVWIALISGLGPIILALGNFIVALKNSIKHDKADVKLDNIQTLANGNLAELRASLRSANEKIKDLEYTIHIMAENKTEHEKEFMRQKSEKLETMVMQEMQAKTDLEVQLIKAKVSPAVPAAEA